MLAPPVISTGRSRLSSSGDQKTDSTLFLWLLRFAKLNDERFYAGEFLLEAVRKIVRSVLEEDDEAKRKEDKKGQPKEATKQRHH